MKKLIIYILILATAAALLASCSTPNNEAAMERLNEALGTLLPADRYTSASYKAYKEAYDEAQSLASAKGVTALTVDRAVDKLNTAKKALVVKNDFTELRRQVEFFQTINESEYSKDSYESYKNAYTAALEVLKNDAAKQSEINSAATRMNNAKLALMKIPDTSYLRLLVNADVDPSAYTGESYADYQKAVEKGIAVLKKECPTLEELRIAENMLVEAYASLMLRGNTDSLTGYIKEVKTKILVPDSKGRKAEDHFAAFGFNAVTNAVAEAEACVKKGDASENELNDAERKLHEAVASLVDISPLLDAYDLAGDYSSTIDRKEYTEDSYKKLSSSMAICYRLMNDPQVSSEEVKKAAADLNAVIAAMERVKVVPDGAKDKPIGDILITVGRSSIQIRDYMNDYTRFFSAVFSENPDFTYNTSGGSAVFSRGKVKAIFSAESLILQYNGPAAVASNDLDAFSVGKARIDDTDTSLTSADLFGVPTAYSEETKTVNGRACSVASIVYENEDERFTFTAEYNVTDKYVLSYTFTFTPADLPDLPAEG